MTLDWPFLRQWIPWLALGVVGAVGGVVAFGVGYLVIHVSLSPAMGFDGRLYAAAAREWLQGGDPWSVQVQGISLAAPPPSLVMAAPFAFLPQGRGAPAAVSVAG